MDFRIADTFTAGLAKLTGDEQKAVKTAAFEKNRFSWSRQDDERFQFWDIQGGAGFGSLVVRENSGFTAPPHPRPDH